MKKILMTLMMIGICGCEIMAQFDTTPTKENLSKQTSDNICDQVVVFSNTNNQYYGIFSGQLDDDLDLYNFTVIVDITNRLGVLESRTNVWNGITNKVNISDFDVYTNCVNISITNLENNVSSIDSKSLGDVFDDGGDFNGDEEITPLRNLNTKYGQDSGLHNTGQSSYQFGESAGSFNSGQSSYQFGESAGSNNNGNYSYQFGESAGYYNTGAYSYQFGKRTGYYNSGQSSYQFGESAGSFNSGQSSYQFGESAGYYNTGAYSYQFGKRAGYYNTGEYSYQLGYKAGRNNNNNYALNIDTYKPTQSIAFSYDSDNDAIRLNNGQLILGRQGIYTNPLPNKLRGEWVDDSNSQLANKLDISTNIITEIWSSETNYLYGNGNFYNISSSETNVIDRVVTTNGTYIITGITTDSEGDTTNIVTKSGSSTINIPLAGNDRINSSIINVSELNITSDRLNISNRLTPNEYTVGKVGDICWDNQYIYICVDDTSFLPSYIWGRIALTFWYTPGEIP